MPRYLHKLIQPLVRKVNTLVVIAAAAATATMRVNDIDCDAHSEGEFHVSINPHVNCASPACFDLAHVA